MIPMPPTGRFGLRRWNQFPVFLGVALAVLLIALIGFVWAAAVSR